MNEKSSRRFRITKQRRDENLATIQDLEEWMSEESGSDVLEVG